MENPIKKDDLGVLFIINLSIILIIINIMIINISYQHHFQELLETMGFQPVEVPGVPDVEVLVFCQLKSIKPRGVDDLWIY